MGDRPTVVTAELNARLCCDQAVFTSIRSPMGQGYRLIAASTGVSAEEKIEITQRSPSHGSLCDSSPEAVGLLSYPLADGRYCVACCIHAGVEHTARGGLRVYTHNLILDAADFTALDADPVRIYAALLVYLRREGPMLKVPSALPPLGLSIPVPAGPAEPAESESANPVPPAAGIAGPEEPSDKRQTETLTQIAADLQTDRSVVVVGVADLRLFLGTLWPLLPPGVRQRLSVSAGLRYAPPRRVRLAILPGDFGGLRRLVVGQNVALHHLDWM